MAISTFDPAIELWDLDLIDALEPSVVLGGFAPVGFPFPPSLLSLSGGKEERADETPPLEPGREQEEEAPAGGKRRQRKKKLKSKPKLKLGSHTGMCERAERGGREQRADSMSGVGGTGAVLGLGFNRHQRHVLASSSEDMTVKLWDVGRAECLQTYGYHQDKVQTVRWHRDEASLLASGAFDRQVCLLDVRQPKPSTTWTLPADVESLEWNPHAPNQLLVASEDGIVSCYSLEGGGGAGKPLWTLQAHPKSVTALALSPDVADLLATISTDKSFKLWDLATAPEPRCLWTTNTSLVRPSLLLLSIHYLSFSFLTHTLLPRQGKLFCGAFYEDSPFLLGVGGKKGLHVYKTNDFETIRQRFSRG